MEFHVTLLHYFLVASTLPVAYTVHRAQQEFTKDNIQYVNRDSNMTCTQLLQDKTTKTEQSKKQNI